MTTREGERRYLGAAVSGVRMESGDEVWRPSSGGGGLGDPLQRPADEVLEDVLDGYVSVERAAKDYGVVLTCVPEGAGYAIDQPGTQEMRARIAADRHGWLEADPEAVRAMWERGEVDLLDLIRRYGVIIDLRTGSVLPKTTRQYREMLQSRMVPWWSGEQVSPVG